MSNPSLVKTPLLSPVLAAPAQDGAASPPVSEAAAPSTPVEAIEAPPDPAMAAVIRLLRPVAEPKLHPEAEEMLPTVTRIEVALSDHWMRVFRGDETVVESPVATGRSISPTPEGRFHLAAKPPAPPSLRYGHYRTRNGVLLVRGVFPKIDPMPVDAVFDQIVPKGLMQLSDDGPMVFGGEATGAATTDGTLVLPDRIALLLHEKLPMGVPVEIVA